MSRASAIYNTPKAMRQHSLHVDQDMATYQNITFPCHGFKSARGTKGWPKDAKYSAILTAQLVEQDTGKKVCRIITNQEKYPASFMPSIRREMNFLRTQNPDDLVMIYIWDAQGVWQCYLVPVIDLMHIYSPSSSDGTYARCKGGHRTKVYPDTVFTLYHSQKYTKRSAFWYSFLLSIA